MTVRLDMTPSVTVSMASWIRATSCEAAIGSCLNIFAAKLNRLAATQRHHRDRGPRTSAGIQCKPAGELQCVQSKPVALAEPWGNINEPAESSLNSGAPESNGHIARACQLAATFSRDTVPCIGIT
jgi:hypothetical protein